MNFLPKHNSAESTGSVRTSSASGSGDSGCELLTGRQPPPPVNWDTSPAEQVADMSGIEPKSSPCWNDGNRLLVRESGQIGQEILDAEGTMVCWTVDPWLAQVIVRLLNRADRAGVLA